MKAINFAGLFIIGNLYADVGLAAAPQTIGWLEGVSVSPQQMLMTAKIDTGADTSSVHAEDINIYDDRGRTMVSFTLRNKHGDELKLVKPLTRYTHIKSKQPGADPIRRPVVKLDICIGNSSFITPVNLANRDNFKYRMLIGRSYLKNGYVVDSNNKHLSKPSCTGKFLDRKQ